MNSEFSRFSLKPLSITLFLMVLLAWVINHNLALIPSVPATASETQFSAERAKLMLSDLLKEQVPHPVDSVANRVVEKRIVKKLREMGFQEEIQETMECRDFEVGVARCTRVRNIIVTIDGSLSIDNQSAKKNGILLVAHYDSVAAGPGASDAGSAVATLLEIARMLATQERPKNSIVILFNEGEEFGLFGAHAFMRQHPLAKTLKLAINIEARGSAGQSVMFETGEKSGWLVEEYIASTPSPLSSSLFYEVYKILPNDTDLTVFKEHGLQGLNFAHGGNEPHYHTPLDSLENLQLGTIQHHGENVWGVLSGIMNKDLTEINESNIVYTDILATFVVKWQEPTSLFASILLILLFVWVAQNLSKESLLNGKSVRKGVYTFFALFVLLTAGALLIQNLVQWFSGGSTPWRVDNFPMQLTLWSFLTLIGLIVGGRISNKTCPTNFVLGLVMCWLVLAVVTSVLMVGISFLFIIPSAIALLILLVLPMIEKRWGKGMLAVALSLISLAVALMFMPIVYVLELMVGYKMSMAIGLMFSFLVSGMTPLLAFNSEAKKSAQRLNYALVAVFALGLIWTVSQPAYTANVPQALNLIHIQKDTGESVLIVGSSLNPPPATLAKALTVNNDSQLESSETVPWSNIVSLNKTLPKANLVSAKVEVLSNQVVEKQKIVELKIEAFDENFRDLILYAPEKSKLVSISYGEKTLNYDKEIAFRNGYYEFQCKGLSCQSSEIKLKFANTDATEILVVKSSTGLPKASQEFANNRGETAVQRQFGDRTVIIKKMIF